jgi:hypothetical protein
MRGFGGYSGCGRSRKARRGTATKDCSCDTCQKFLIFDHLELAPYTPGPARNGLGNAVASGTPYTRRHDRQATNGRSRRNVRTWER